MESKQETVQQANPTLVIMAAGMGSRYGGLKQIDPVTDTGEIILDFSLYDAMMAGFEDVVIIIKEENEEIFREILDQRAGKFLNIKYAFQKLDNIPKGYEVPEGREKPWGTGHAVLSAKELVNGAFAVINADDYYGPYGFNAIYDFLSRPQKGNKYHFCMVGYELKNTITENGHVARGVCTVSQEGMLEDIIERTKIVNKEDGICFTEDEKTWEPLDEDTVVSMNFWGYSKEMMAELEKQFSSFLDDQGQKNPLKGEYLIPSVTDNLIKMSRADVKVLPSKGKWFGVTYKEDKPNVSASIQSLKDKGLYPPVLWGQEIEEEI